MKQTESLAKLACAYSGLVWGLFRIPLRARDGAGIAGAWATVLLYLVPAVLVLPIAPWCWRDGAAARYDARGGPRVDPRSDWGRLTPFTY